jgi:bla regulator protein blaR1
VFAGTVFLATVLLRNNRPSLRYALWMAASLKFLLPFSLLVGLGAVLPKTFLVATQPNNSIYSALEAANQPFDNLLPSSAQDRHPGLSKPPSALLPAFLFAAWICGTLTVLLVWYLRLRQVASLLRDGESPGGGREAEILRSLQSEGRQRGGIPVVRSTAAMEPGISGIFRPILLWPEQLSAQLEDQHVRAIMAHELAHVRRRDNLTAGTHMLVEALFWFHPVVWWIESRMVKERECACDEEVVGSTAPEIYAESLLIACRFCIESPLSCVSGIAGADLRDRVMRITTHRRGAHLSLTRKASLVAAALAVLAVPTSFGLIEGMQSKKSLLHPTVSPPPAFEVATIKPNNDPQAGLRIDMSPSNFNAIGGSLKDLIEYAYNVNSQDQVQGEPAWISSRRFDIHAKASESTIASFHHLSVMQQVTELRLMLQSLLVDRFQLKVSFKTADLPVYALVVAKGGPKFKEVEADPLPPPGTPPRPGAHLPRLGKTGANQYTAVAWDMSSTADFLSRFDEVGHRIVVDETGLKGHYDFVLNGISVWSSSDGSTTSIFTALEEQLGLKLEPRKAPVEVVVIDRVEPPTEN